MYYRFHIKDYLLENELNQELTKCVGHNCNKMDSEKFGTYQTE
jgi:hypothetical protein